jgi:hypothetical protein
MGTRDRSRVTAGAILILLGIVLILMQVTEGFPGETGTFLIGGLFVAGYLYRRAYGMLIPGCILLGIGLGSIGENSPWDMGDFGSIGLGVGFVAIYLIALVYEGRTHWWPLVPGGALIISGLASGSETFQELLSVGWPALIILVGLLLLAGSAGIIGRRAD